MSLTRESPIADLECSVRVMNRLHDLECKTVGDILKVPMKEFFLLRNFGRKSLWELIETLQWHGFRIGQDHEGTS